DEFIQAGKKVFLTASPAPCQHPSEQPWTLLAWLDKSAHNVGTIRQIVAASLARWLANALVYVLTNKRELL
ncbi:MAG: hypothetical protein ACOYMG_27595, partial [Candidatus Methylumidiphilus sp.]